MNPGQSGSVTTAFDAILQRRGWIDGWRILRRAAANARYFSASALKPPIDVSRGDAAMGICIDFYGRYQAQALKSASGRGALGYVDPPGETMIDPDPISLLERRAHLELAKRFVEFCLSEEGQALWQFKVGDTGGDGLGPREFELRRMPIRRDMYERYFDRLIDQVNPYLIASPLETYHREYRAFITLLLTSLGIDNHDLLAQAWSAIVTHPGYPSDPERIVTAQDVQDPILRQMLELFDQLPAVPGPEGRPRSLEEPGSLPEIKSGWLRGDWKEQGLWNEDEPSEEALRRLLTSRFRENYRKIIAAGQRLRPVESVRVRR